MKTTSYKISKKLAEVGFEAETNLWWLEDKPDVFGLHYSKTSYVGKAVRGYDLETILEALPEWLGGEYITVRPNEIFYYGDIYHVYREFSESLADTAARLLLLLVEKGVLTFNK